VILKEPANRLKVMLTLEVRADMIGALKTSAILTS